VGTHVLLARLIAHWTGLSSFKKVLLCAATTAFLIEVGFRLLAPRSRAYARWTAGLETVGDFWTGVLLAIVYFVSLAFIAVCFRLFGKDPLDRSLLPEPSFWRSHEPNPLGPEGAARHQF
jgi:hypothetical protein